MRFGRDHEKKKRWHRLASALVTGAFYFIAACPFGPSCSAVPMNKSVARADFPCALHACGCKTAEMCRTHCCCFPGGNAQATAVSQKHAIAHGPMAVRISYFAALRCSGQDPLGPFSSAPKLAEQEPAGLPHVPRLTRAIFCGRVHREALLQGILRSPEKIPI